jgi:6-phosphogluconate dehydrogenase
MQLGMIGRMGANIVRRLMRAQHRCVVFDQNADAVASLAAEGAIGATSFADLVTKLAKPRTVWVMLPVGEITEAMVTALAGVLEAGDTIIDGGNTFWKDDVRRARERTPKASLS